MERNTKIALGVGGGLAAAGGLAWALARRRATDAASVDPARWPLTRRGTTPLAISPFLAANLSGLLTPGEPRRVVRLDLTDPVQQEGLRGMARDIAVRLLCKFESRVSYYAMQSLGRPCNPSMGRWPHGGPEVSSGVQPWQVFASEDLRPVFASEDLRQTVGYEPRMPANLGRGDLMAYSPQEETQRTEIYGVPLCETDKDFWSKVIGHSDDRHFASWVSPPPTAEYRDAYHDLFRVYNPRSILVREVAGYLETQTPSGARGSLGVSPMRIEGIRSADIATRPEGWTTLGQMSILLMGYPIEATGATAQIVGPASWRRPELLDVNRMVALYVRDWIAHRMMKYVPNSTLAGQDAPRYQACFSISSICFLAAAAMEMGLMGGDGGDMAPSLSLASALLWQRLIYVPPPPAFGYWSLFTGVVAPILASFVVGPLGAMATTAIAGALATAQSTLAPIVAYAAQTLGSSMVRGGLSLELGPLRFDVDTSGNTSIGAYGQTAVTGNLAGGGWTWDAPAVGYPNEMEEAATRARQEAADWTARGHYVVPSFRTLLYG